MADWKKFHEALLAWPEKKLGWGAYALAPGYCAMGAAVKSVRPEAVGAWDSWLRTEFGFTGSDRVEVSTTNDKNKEETPEQRYERMCAWGKNRAAEPG